MADDHFNNLRRLAATPLDRPDLTWAPAEIDAWADACVADERRTQHLLRRATGGCPPEIGTTA
jgi:hypothetical protein